MPTTTTTTVAVTRRAMDMYNLVTNEGLTIKAASDRLGYSGGGGGAAYGKVRDAIAAGHIVTVKDGDGGTTTVEPTAVDVDAVLTSIGANPSIKLVLSQLDDIDSAHKKAIDRAERLESEAANLRTGADEAREKAMRDFDVIAAALNFDRATFDAAMEAAREAAAPTDEDADAEDADADAEDAEDGGDS